VMEMNRKIDCALRLIAWYVSGSEGFVQANSADKQLEMLVPMMTVVGKMRTTARL